MEVPVVTKNNPRNKPLNGLISASICVRKLVSANSAPAKNAPSFIEMEFSYNINLKIINQNWEENKNRITKAQLLGEKWSPCNC